MKNKILLFSALLLIIGACQPSVQKVNEMEPKQQGINYSALGDSIAAQTQMALAAVLKAAMKRGGAAEAIKYCNINALSLTDSLARHFHVSIKRATPKPRNESNTATADEVGILNIWETKMHNEGTPNPVLFEGEQEVNFYKPIFVQPLCTTCHGQAGETLLPETQELIKETYPTDQAINYQVGDLRGMWHITFSKRVLK